MASGVKLDHHFRIWALIGVVVGLNMSLNTNFVKIGIVKAFGLTYRTQKSVGGIWLSYA